MLNLDDLTEPELRTLLWYTEGARPTRQARAFFRHLSQWNPTRHSKKHYPTGYVTALRDIHDYIDHRAHLLLGLNGATSNTHVVDACKAACNAVYKRLPPYAK